MSIGHSGRLTGRERSFGGGEVQGTTRTDGVSESGNLTAMAEFLNCVARDVFWPWERIEKTYPGTGVVL